MKRRNVQLAFVGEGTTNEDDMGQLADGDDAVDIAITGGKLMVVVPAMTPDDQIFEKAERIGGEILLENGLRLSFEIEGEATGAQFNAAPADDQEDTHPGLSALPNIPGGS